MSSFSLLLPFHVSQRQKVQTFDTHASKITCRGPRHCLPLCNFHQTDQTQLWLSPHLWVSDLPVASSPLGGYKSHSGFLDAPIDNNLSCDRPSSGLLTSGSTMQWLGLRGVLLLCCAAACVSAVTREYFLKIEEVSWNYAPTGMNVIQNRTLQDDE